MKNYLFLAITLSSLFFSCSRYKDTESEKPIASVYDKNLYSSELKEVIPNNLTEEDSISFIKNYIDNWMIKQLLLKKAELNLPDEQKDLSKLLDDYRTTLLVYKYEQQLINQKMDTVVTDEEINSYYEEHAGEFKLRTNIVKVIYVKVPVSAYDAFNVRKWYRIPNEANINSIEDYCYQNASKFIIDDSWHYANSIFKDVPVKVNNVGNYLRTHKLIELKDSLYRYFINIRDYRLVNDTTPLVYVRNDIKNIIINKRKHHFINELENSVYEDALTKKEFTVNY
ncbi:MAG: hypothetical protein KAG95_05320 [Bacteroidales bacterium]|nr:hypothetical protein [Bacteroidales bacterium]